MDIHNNKIFFNEKVGQNPAVTFHNLTFNDPAKKRSRILDEMKTFLEIKDRFFGNQNLDPKPEKKSKSHKSNIKKDRNVSVGKALVESSKNKLGFISVSLRENKYRGSSPVKKRP